MPPNNRHRRAEDRPSRREIWQNVCSAVAVVICLGAGVFIKLTSEDSKFVDGLFAAFMFAAVAFAVPTNFKRLVETVGPYVPLRRQSLARRAIDESSKAVKASKKAATAARELADTDSDRG